MSHVGCGVGGHEGDAPLPWRVLADRLALGAAPAFATMALLTSAAGAPHLLCAAPPGVPLLGGMAPMYWLMSMFHAGPWLRLISGGGGSGHSR